jgi:hypothetical protein
MRSRRQWPAPGRCTSGLPTGKMKRAARFPERPDFGGGGGDQSGGCRLGLDLSQSWMIIPSIGTFVFVMTFPVRNLSGVAPNVVPTRS